MEGAADLPPRQRTLRTAIGHSYALLDEEERTLLKEIGAEIRIIPFEAGYSTSRLLEQICKSGH